MNNDDRFPSQSDPSPRQIADRARRIRANWTERERLARHAASVGLRSNDKRLPRIIERAQFLPDISGES